MLSDVPTFYYSFSNSASPRSEGLCGKKSLLQNKYVWARNWCRYIVQTMFCNRQALFILWYQSGWNWGTGTVLVQIRRHPLLIDIFSMRVCVLRHLGMRLIELSAQSRRAHVECRFASVVRRVRRALAGWLMPQHAPLTDTSQTECTFSDRKNCNWTSVLELAPSLPCDSSIMQCQTLLSSNVSSKRNPSKNALRLFIPTNSWFRNVQKKDGETLKN